MSNIVLLTSNLRVPLPAVDTFSDTFASGLNGRWQQAGSAWTAPAGAALCTPTLGAELLTNGDFTTDTSGWTAAGSALASVAGGQSGNGLQITNSGAAIGRADQQIAPVTGLVKVALHQKNGSAGGGVYLGTRMPQATYGFNTFSNAAWTQKYHSSVVGINTYFSLFCNSSTAAATTNFDTISIKQITLADTIASVGGLKNSANISAACTMDTANGVLPLGVAGWIDSYTNPQNFLIACYERNTLRLWKCVAGIFTSVLNISVAYSAGQTITLKGTRSGSNLLVKMFYGAVQQGTEQTISNAAIVSNTRHGMFSTHSGNTIDNFAVTAYG